MRCAVKWSSRLVKSNVAVGANAQKLNILHQVVYQRCVSCTLSLKIFRHTIGDKRAAMAEGLEERKAEKVDMEAAGENAPKAAGKKKTSKARMDKSEEDAINASKAAAYLKDEEA